MIAAGLALVTALAAIPVPAHAQDAPDDHENDVIRKLELKGVQHVDESELRFALHTEATRCKGLLLKPFCWITGSPYFTEYHRLDNAERLRDELRIKVIYWRRGYRDAQVRSEVAPGDDGVNVAFHIEEGPATIAERVEVQQMRPVLDSVRIRRAGMLQGGDVLDLIVLDTARLRLQRTLWDRGHADAVFRDTTLFSDSLHATLVFTIDPRPRTTIDTVMVRGNEDVTTRTVRRLVDLREDGVYRRSEVLAAQRRLYRSQLFNQALIVLPEQADSAKDLVVTVSEAPPNAVRFGVGVNTTEFGQVEANWTRYNWIGTARRLDVQAAVGNLFASQLYGRSIFGSSVPAGIADEVPQAFLDPTWRASVSVTQPWLFSTRNSIGASAFMHRRSVPGVVIDRGFGGSLTVTRELAELVPLSLTYRFERNRVEAGGVYFCVNFGTCDFPTIEALQQPNRLSPLTLRLLADRADDPLEPRRGYTARAELEHASAATLSDYRYHRAEGEFATYRRLGAGTLAFHVRGGWVRALASTLVDLPAGSLESELLHPSKRVYAGGARSVRGYAENQLGPRVLTVDPDRLTEPDDSTVVGCSIAQLDDGSCDPDFVDSRRFVPRPVGGNTVLEGSVEYRMNLTPTIVAAGFVDGARVTAGDAAFGENRTAITPGVGVRYRSPIGPIRVDLALRPSGVEQLQVITQVGEGGNRRLVQLTTPKAYDPLEGRGGIRRFLARLQLHLAIGEAY
jgi:outer membrane protein insertion porin family/translocation and assembly module TamA